MNAILPSIVIGFALLAPMSANAQAAAVDEAAIAAACALDVEACLAAIEQAIAALEAQGLPADQLNTQLGVLAAVVLQQAAAQPAGSLAAFAGALESIASKSTDPVQKANLAQVAALVSSGTVPSTSAFAELTQPLSNN